MSEASSAHSEKALPRSFRLIRIELAREPGHPEGSAAIGYKIVAPLDADDRLDADVWRANRQACRVVHFQPSARDEVGHLIHRPGGSWAFHYDIQSDAGDDEVGYHFQSERFVVGEYVSLNVDGKMHTFQIKSVERL